MKAEEFGYEDIGVELGRRRVALGLSYQDAADLIREKSRVRVTKQWVYDTENAKGKAPLDKLRAYAKAVGLKLDVRLLPEDGSADPVEATPSQAAFLKAAHDVDLDPVDETVSWLREFTRTDSPRRNRVMVLLRLLRGMNEKQWKALFSIARGLTQLRPDQISTMEILVERWEQERAVPIVEP